MMKKILILLIAAVTVSSAAAQDFTWGVKAGVNFSTLSGGDAHGSGYKADFVGGVFISTQVNDWLGLTAEGLYSGEGAHYADKDYMHTSYINVPILANFHIYDRLCVNAGIQPGFCLNTKHKRAALVPDADVDTFSFAIPIGLSYSWECGLLLDLRYNIGLTPIHKDLSAYNSSFALTVGWRF